MRASEQSHIGCEQTINSWVCLPGGQTQSHIVWGQLPGDSSDSRSNTSSSDRILGERPPNDLLQSWNFAPDEVTFLPMSGSSNSSTSSKREVAHMFSRNTTQDNGIPDSSMTKTLGPTTESHVLTASGSNDTMPLRLIKQDGTASVSWETDSEGSKPPPDGIDNSIQDTSIGSIQHHDGNCKPCAFLNSKYGCKRGVECPFCHLEHEIVEKVKKPCKGQRERYKKLVDRFTKQILQDPVAFDVSTLEYPPSYMKDEASRSKLISKLQQIQVSALKTQYPSSTFVSL